ncbi:ATP-binding protein [Humisphaera borealis]|uniref:ATP-binding protein n=1 Tax=Humisphaera borealis TaxID=2807512 RepID=UPI0019D0193C|nr:ATP-binding protein [Humisphaera borealis]
MATAIIFCGLQGSGKSTFYARQFANTHIRLNLDMLRTRNREDILLHGCLAAQQAFVVDNTNPSPSQRMRYVALARAAGFESLECYWFDTGIEECIARNATRPDDARVPEIAIRGTAAKLMIPSKAEGFDRVWRVTWTAAGIEQLSELT